MISVRNRLTGRISNRVNLKGKLNTTVKEITPTLDDLEVTPTKEQQVFNHENSYGYDNVTVNPIPDEYIIPDGTLDVDANGDVDVTMFRMARVGVYTPPNLQDKEITINENGTHNIVADEEYDGLNQVSVTVDAIEDLSEELETYSNELETQNITITDIMGALGTKSSGESKQPPMLNKEALIEGLNNTCEQFLRDIVYNQNPLLSYTTNPVTLYTPVATHKFYIIRKRKDNGKYQVHWTAGSFPVYSMPLTGYYFKYFYFNNINLLSTKREDIQITVKDWNSVSGTTDGVVYSSATQDTIEDCIQVLKNLKSTTYTTSTSHGWGSVPIDDKTGVDYTNLPYYLNDDVNKLGVSRVISPNEVVKVLPSKEV